MSLQPLMVFPERNLDVIGRLAQGDPRSPKVIVISKAVLISNPNQKKLLWHAEPDPNAKGWLTLDPAVGTLQPGGLQEIDLSVDTNDLAIGKQPVVLTFTSEEDALPTEVQVPVTLDIVSKPGIDINPPLPGPGPRPPVSVGLDFDLSSGSSQTSPVAITNRLREPASWTASIVTDAKAKSWLSLDRMTGTITGNEDETLWVTANASALPIGEYTATISIVTTAPGARTNSATINVTLHVGLRCYSDNGPHCALINEDFVHFDLGTIAGSHFNVAGSTSLQATNDPQNPGPVQFSVENGGVNWLTPHPAGGKLETGVQQQIDLTVGASLLEARDQSYTTSLSITVTDEENFPGHPSTKVVPVSVTVHP